MVSGGLMFNVINLTDKDKIKQIFIDYKLYNIFADDDSPLLEVWSPNTDQMYWLIVLDQNKIAGLFPIQKRTTYLCEGHVFVHPAYRGRQSRLILKSALQWLKVNTEFKTILGLAPANNKHMIKLAKSCGFKEIGILHKAMKKNNEFVDNVLLEVQL